MVFKWALVAFGVTAAALFALGKVLAFLNPPRPGRPRPPPPPPPPARGPPPPAGLTPGGTIPRVDAVGAGRDRGGHAGAGASMTDTASRAAGTLALDEKLDKVPDRPGVYLCKAASLRNRVRSYFHESRVHDPKTDALVGQIRDLDYIVTSNELEALIL